VRIGDSVWLAEGPTLAAGAAIVVKSVRGARVVVEAASS
jgi:membrane protein implicated in regulation of membrane protease activity